MSKKWLVMVGATVCFAVGVNVASASTANIYNDTTCSCQGMYPDFKNCKIKGNGVTIQMVDGSFKPLPTMISPGSTGSAPIFQMTGRNTISAEASGSFPVEFQGANPGQTYFMIDNPMSTDMDSFAITPNKPC